MRWWTRNLESCAFPLQSPRWCWRSLSDDGTVCSHAQTELVCWTWHDRTQANGADWLCRSRHCQDVVPLDENNRILRTKACNVFERVKLVRVFKPWLRLQTRCERLVASDFGFALGPRINAAGRLDDMSFGVELLMSNNIHAARRMASELDGLNQTRKEIEEGMETRSDGFLWTTWVW